MNQKIVTIEWTRPHPWPPRAPVSVVGSHGKGVPELVCFSDGHLAVFIGEHPDRKEFHFQRIDLPERAWVKIQLELGPQGFEVFLGDVKLDRQDEAAGRALVAKNTIPQLYGMESRSISRELLSSLPRDERLFLETLGDITAKVTEPSHYGLVRLSALLRQLMFDGQPLAIAANRRHRLSLSFQLAVSSDDLDPSLPGPEIHWLSLYPTQPDRLVTVGLDRFLKTPTFRVHGKERSVQELIGMVAHVMGGVHTGKAENEAQQDLELVEKQLVLNEPLVLHAVLDIAKITLQALLPLATAIADQDPGQ